MEFYYIKEGFVYGMTVTEEVIKFHVSNLNQINDSTCKLISPDNLRCSLNSVLDLVDPLEIDIFKCHGGMYPLKLYYSNGKLGVTSNYDISPYDIIDHVRSQF